MIDVETEMYLAELYELVDKHAHIYPGTSQTLKYRSAIQEIDKRTMRDIPNGYRLYELHNRYKGRWNCTLQREKDYQTTRAHNTNTGYDSPGEAIAAAIALIEPIDVDIKESA